MILCTPVGKLKNALQRKVEEYLDFKRLQEIEWDFENNEYREYLLYSITQKQGIDHGGIDDMLIVFNTWKRDSSDKVLKYYLEYQTYDYFDGKHIPSGINEDVGILINIEKE